MQSEQLIFFFLFDWYSIFFNIFNIKMESLCSNLIETYNTNYLDSEDLDTAECFYETSENHKDGEKGRTTLMKCIVNHFTKQKLKVKYIGGPISLSYHRKDRKHIYIFGEYHSPRIDCPPQAEIMKVEDYLYEVLKNTDVFLDIYFELDPPEGRDSSYKDYDNIYRLIRLFFKFKECIDYATRFDDICRLARIHYTDYRHIGKKSSRITNFYLSLSDYTQYPNIDKLFSESSIEVLNILSMRNGEDEYVNLFLGMIRENYYLVKELDKSLLKNEIEFFTMTKLKSIIKERKTLITDISNIILGLYEQYKRGIVTRDLIDNIKDSVRILKSYIIGIVAKEMDLYLLSRVFRKFDITRPYAKPNQKDEEESKYTDQPVEPHNIVIYAGDLHSCNCREFLSYIGFEEVSIIEEKEYNTCLDVRNFPQPFFSSV